MFGRPSHRTTLFVGSVALALIACADRRRPAPVRETVELSLAHLPAESSAVIQLDVTRLAASPLVVRAATMIAARDAASADRLKDFFARCGIDLTRDLGDVTIVLGAPGPTQDAALFVKGNLDEQRLLGCVAEITHEERHGIPVHRTTDATSPVWFAFVAPGTLLAATSATWLDQFIDPGAPRLAPTAPLLLLVAGEAQRDAMAWGAGLLPSGVGDRIVALTEGDVTRPARAVTFRVDADAGLTLRIALEMATEGDAEKLVAFAGDQRGWLAIVAGRYGVEELVRQFKMSRPDNGRLAVLEARVEPALVEQVAALLGRAEIR